VEKNKMKKSTKLFAAIIVLGGTLFGLGGSGSGGSGGGVVYQ
jgi:hypothetical protein